MVLKQKENTFLIMGFLFLISAHGALAQTQGGIGSIADEIGQKNQFNQDGISSIYGNKEQNNANRQLNELARNMSRVENSCNAGTAGNKYPEGNLKFCSCYARLIAQEFQGVEFEYHAKVFEGVMSKKNENKLSLDLALFAANNGLTEQNVARINRNAKVLQNYAVAHFQYGEQCKKW